MPTSGQKLTFISTEQNFPQFVFNAILDGAQFDQLF